MSSSLTRMTALWPTRRSVSVARMSLEGRASRFHWGPANDRNRRVLLVAPCPGQGLLSDHLAAAQPWRRERVFVPRSWRSKPAGQTPRKGGSCHSLALHWSAEMCPGARFRGARPVSRRGRARLLSWPGPASRQPGHFALRSDVVQSRAVDNLNMPAITEGNHALACEGPE
jgi:hypothetical protein